MKQFQRVDGRDKCTQPQSRTVAASRQQTDQLLMDGRAICGEQVRFFQVKHGAVDARLHASLLPDQHDPRRHVPRRQARGPKAIDPSGQPTKYSDFTVTTDGRLTFDFTPALNDPLGNWTLSVTDLTSGTVTRRPLELRDPLR